MTIEAQKGFKDVTPSYCVSVSRWRPMPYFTVVWVSACFGLIVVDDMSGIPWNPCAIVRQTVMIDAATMNTSSFPGLWTMKIRLYRRSMTAEAAMIVNVMVTPRTAVGSACPERPILASAKIEIAVRPSTCLRKSRGMFQRQCDNCRASATDHVWAGTRGWCAV
jgi:hypothetical protein